VARLDETKMMFARKFADKNEMVKNVKYLETEIKHFVEVTSKKAADRSDNWLLAKKPLGNFTCASCENYIGDLQDKNQFVPWNKVPIRDPSDRLYRIGNGFSRMLQLIYLDSTQSKSKDSKDNTDVEATGDMTKVGRIKSNRHRKAKPNDSMSIDMNTEYIKTDINNTVDDGFKPKVYDIFKKG
jgi:hypothetical protein